MKKSYFFFLTVIKKRIAINKSAASPIASSGLGVTKAFFLFSFMVLMTFTTAMAQFGTSPWTAPTGTYTVPAGVSSITVDMWGGGGAGGSIYPTGSGLPETAGGGGGGGAYSKTVVSVVAGQSIVVTIGAGGTPTSGGSAGNGNPGGTTSIVYNSVAVAYAAGGDGGGGSYSGGVAAGGAGGAPLIGNVVYGGGNGGSGSYDGSTVYGGGGGGGAGTTANGANGCAVNCNTGGAGGVTGGGSGGNGAANLSLGDGSPGNSWGGGGGGASGYYPTGATGGTGGTGSAGNVIINYSTNLVGPGWINQNCTTAVGSYIDGGAITPTSTVQTSSVATNTGNYGFVYWTLAATAGATYYFDLCSSTGTTGDGWLRLHNAQNFGSNYCMDVSSTPTLVMQNNSNGCAGTGSGLSKLIWTCPTSGTYYLESSDAALSPWGASGNQSAILSYKTLPSSSSTCTDVFYDKGIDGTNGSSTSYNNNENWTYTYYPTNTVADAISVQFIAFNTSSNDNLCIYDGNSTTAPLIGCYSGTTVPPAFSSTASDGSITFRFTSDDSGISTGWQANISCVANVGVVSNSLTNVISLFPNPVNDRLDVSGVKVDGNTNIQVFDVVGKSIFSNEMSRQIITNSSQNHTSINVSTLLPGIYFIRIENETGAWNGKFVKQ